MSEWFIADRLRTGFNLEDVLDYQKKYSNDNRRYPKEMKLITQEIRRRRTETTGELPKSDAEKVYGNKLGNDYYDELEKIRINTHWMGGDETWKEAYEVLHDD